MLLLLTAIHAFDGDLTLSTFLTALLIAAAVFAGLSLLVLLLFYGNKYEYRYTVNAHGVLSETTGKTLKKNTVANFLLALSVRPGPTGAGLMAQSRQSEEVKWGSVSRFTSHSARHEIVLYRGKLASMVIACTAENFESIVEIMEKSVKP